MKIKTISLETWEQVHRSEIGKTVRKWRVVRVTDSIEYSPRDELTKAQVDELCAAKDWKVTITALTS